MTLWTRARVLTIAIAVVVMVLTVSAEVAWAVGEHAVAVVTGTAQGTILGDEPNKIYGPGTITVLAIGHAIVVPLDSATGFPAGKRQHQPLQIIKLPDKSSPKLLKALVTGESLTVELRFFRTVSTGAVVLYHVFKLTGAIIVSIHTGGSTSVDNGVTETVSFAYSKIEVTDTVNNVIAVDTWSGQ